MLRTWEKIVLHSDKRFGLKATVTRVIKCCYGANSLHVCSGAIMEEALYGAGQRISNDCTYFTKVKQSQAEENGTCCKRDLNSSNY